MILTEVSEEDNKMKHVLLIVLMAGLMVITGCHVGDEPVVENPVPQITSISPASKVSHMTTFTLTVTGSGFLRASKIYFNGTEKSTTFVSSGEITCSINPDEILASPVPSGTSKGSDVDLPVYVNNPAPGGGDSDIVNFQVNSNFEFQTPDGFYIRDGSLTLPKFNIDGNGNINIFWTDFWYIGDSNGVFFGRSEDNGGSWNTRKVMSTIINGICQGYLTRDGQGNLYMVGLLFHDQTYRPEILASGSSDNGVTWSPPLMLSDFTADCCIDATDTRIDADRQGNLYIIWAERSTATVYMIRSTDQGANWSDKINLTDSIGIPSLPQVSSSPTGDLYVTWSEPVGNGSMVYFASSPNLGDTWNLPVVISFNTENVWELYTASDDNGNIDVAWLEYVRLSDCVTFNWRRSENGGGLWSSRTDDATIHCDDDTITSFVIDAAGNINVVWVIEDASADYLSYFSRSTDYGATWTSPLMIAFPAYTGDIYGRLARIAADALGNIKIIWRSRQYDDENYSHNVLHFSSSIE